MSKEAETGAKALIGYKAGVTYKFGDWLAATALHCEALLMETKAGDTLQRVALANALDVLRESMYWFDELKEAASSGERSKFGKMYATLKKKHPALLKACDEIARHGLPLSAFVDPVSYPGGGNPRFIKKTPLEDLRALSATARKHEKALNEAKITLDAFYGHGKGQYTELPVSGSEERVTCAYTLRVGSIEFSHDSGYDT